MRDLIERLTYEAVAKIYWLRDSDARLLTGPVTGPAVARVIREAINAALKARTEDAK